ncbi:hypothetical protein [Streptomyces rubiginosohelvolus]
MLVGAQQRLLISPDRHSGLLPRFVSEAVAHALALTKTREIVDAYEDEHGSFTREEIKEARPAWHGE